MAAMAWGLDVVDADERLHTELGIPLDEAPTEDSILADIDAAEGAVDVVDEFAKEREAARDALAPYWFAASRMCDTVRKQYGGKVCPDKMFMLVTEFIETRKIRGYSAGMKWGREALQRLHKALEAGTGAKVAIPPVPRLRSLAEIALLRKMDKSRALFLNKALEVRPTLTVEQLLELGLQHDLIREAKGWSRKST